MLARKSFLVVVTQFFSRALGWIGLVILANLWGAFAPEALGTIGFAMAFVGVFNIIADLGFNQAHVKRVSEGKDLGTCIGTFSVIKIVLTNVMVVVVLGAIFIWENVLHQGIYDATTKSVLLVFILYYVFVDLQQIASCTFNGRGEIAKLQISGIFENFVKVPLTLVVALAGVSIAGHPPAVSWPEFLQPLQRFLASHALGSLAMTYLFGGITTFVIGLWFLRKYPWKKPSWEVGKNYLLFASPLLILSVVSTISTFIDKITIGYFWTSIEVGYYFSIQQILQIFLIFSTALTVVLLPAFSEYHTHKNFEKINQIIEVVDRYISMTLIPVVVVIILFAHPLISIMLNSSFWPATSVLIILTLSALFTSFMTPCSSLLIGINKPGTAAKIGLIMYTVNITLNFLFIPKWGLLSPFGIYAHNGAAVATIISAIVGFTGFKIATARETGLKILRVHTLYHIVAGLLMGGTLYYISMLFPVARWYQFLIFSIMGLAIYLGILFMLKEFKKQDLHFFLKILHPKEMFSYISSELKEKELHKK